MRLDDLVFGEVVKALGAVAGPDEDPRRRRAERYHCRAEVMIRPVGMAMAVSRRVMLVNISATGACVIDQMTQSAGAQFVIALPLPGQMPIEVLCTVRQSRLTGGGGFQVGAEFTSGMEGRDRLVRGVDGLLATAPDSGQIAEGEVRLPARFAAIGDRGDGQVYSAEVCEIGHGMLVFNTPVRVPVGAYFALEIRPGHPNRQVMKCTAVQVKALDVAQYRVWARCDGVPPAARQPSSGIREWFRKMF